MVDVKCQINERCPVSERVTLFLICDEEEKGSGSLVTSGDLHCCKIYMFYLDPFFDVQRLMKNASTISAFGDVQYCFGILNGYWGTPKLLVT